MSDSHLDRIQTLLAGGSALGDDFEYELLLRGAIDYCLQDGSPLSVSLIENACHLDSFQSIRNRGLAALAGLAETGNQDAINALYRLALFTPINAARQMCLAHPWEPSDPSFYVGLQFINKNHEFWEEFDPDLSLLSDLYINQDSPHLRSSLTESAKEQGLNIWVQILQALTQPTTQSIRSLIDLFPRCVLREKTIIARYLSELVTTRLDASDTLCEIAILYQDSQCISTALKYKLRPSDPSLAAVFLFLTSQWVEYESLDFDHHLLSHYFLTANPHLQSVILAHSRDTGYTQWLVETHTSKFRLLSDLTDSDWNSIHQRLLQQKDFDRLFQLSLVAPLNWAASFLVSLRRVNYEVADKSLAAAFAELTHQAALCLLHPPELTRIRGVDLLTVPISAALNNQQGLLAIATQLSKIEIWQTHHLNLGARTINLPSPTHKIAFDQAGEFIAAASSDHQIRIYRLTDTRLVKTLSYHTSWIKDLQFSPDNRVLLSTGFDGTVCAFRFPAGPDLSRIRLPYKEAVSLSHCSIDDLWTVTGVNQSIYRFQLPSMRILQEWQNLETGFRFHCEGGKHPILAGVTNTGTLQIWNPMTARLLAEPLPTANPLSSLIFSESDHFLFSSNNKGGIFVYSVPLLEVITSVNTSSSIIGLFLDLEGILYAIHDNGSLELFDTTELQLCRSADLELRENSINHLKEQLSHSAWLNLTQQIFRFKHQYDIELGFPQFLNIGEFDVLLDE